MLSKFHDAQIRKAWKKFAPYTHIDQWVVLAQCSGIVMLLNHREQRMLSSTVNSQETLESALSADLGETTDFSTQIWSLLTHEDSEVEPDTKLPNIDILGHAHIVRAQVLTSSSGDRTVIIVLTPEFATQTWSEPNNSEPSQAVKRSRSYSNFQDVESMSDSSVSNNESSRARRDNMLSPNDTDSNDSKSPESRHADSSNLSNLNNTDTSGRTYLLANTHEKIEPRSESHTTGMHPDQLHSGPSSDKKNGHHTADIHDFIPHLNSNHEVGYYYSMIPANDHNGHYADVAPDTLPKGTKSVTAVENEAQDPDEMFLTLDSASTAIQDDYNDPTNPANSKPKPNFVRNNAEGAAKPASSGQKSTLDPGHRCLECGTDKSPEWRKGPSGAKTLCNACGLRYAKRLRVRPN